MGIQQMRRDQSRVKPQKRTWCGDWALGADCYVALKKDGVACFHACT